MSKELRRERTELPDGFCIDVPCERCGKSLRLWYNGGELDYRVCCGLVYELEHANGVDLMVREADEDD